MSHTCFDLLHGRYRFSHVPGAILIFDMKPNIRFSNGARPFASVPADGEDSFQAAQKALNWLRTQKVITDDQYDEALAEAKERCNHPHKLI